MLTLAGLLLVCLSSRAATLARLTRPGGDDRSVAPRTHSVDSFSNSSLLTLSSHTAKTAQTSAQHGREEEESAGTHEADGHTTGSLPWADPRTPSDSLTSADPTGPRLLDAADTWTEAAHLRAEEASVLPSSQELGTEATMSSEDLPLIFEPFEDPTPPSEESTAAVTAGDSELMLSMGAEHTSSDVRLLGTADCLLPEMRVSVTESHPAEEQSDGVTRSSVLSARAPQSEDLESKGDGVTRSSVLSARAPQSEDLESKGDGVTRSSVLSARAPQSEDLESKEEPEEDEEDEEMDSDEEEEESEEDLMESTMAPHTRPPYSLIPPPPVWVQRNQGLVRSWVELIREKAGYVSGMLAPVGIGIAGALLLVGALYSIRLIHRKRRDSFKHQRRKPPREVRSGPDNAMLLADSSEDEF